MSVKKGIVSALALAGAFALTACKMGGAAGQTRDTMVASSNSTVEALKAIGVNPDPVQPRP